MMEGLRFMVAVIALTIISLFIMTCIAALDTTVFNLSIPMQLLIFTGVISSSLIGLLILSEMKES